MAKRERPDNESEFEVTVDEQAGETAPKPDPWAIMQQLANALTVLTERQATAPASTDSELLLKLTEAMERIADANLAGSQLIASETRRAHRPSNEVVPNISVFNRRGELLEDYQKPKLKCIMMVPWLIEWESVTREEVELLNLLQPGDYQLKRVDNSKIRVQVRIDYGVDNVTPSRLVLNHETGFNNDNFRLVPPLVELLRQILRQHDTETRIAAANVMSDEVEEAMIEAGELSVSL